MTPHILDQSDLNDLVRDLGLTKKKSKLLASRLKQWNLLQKGVKGNFYRTRHAQLEKYFAAGNYNQKEWLVRKEFVLGRFINQYVPLVDKQKIYLPPLHIKLGLFKNFVKAMDSTKSGSIYWTRNSKNNG